MIRPWQDQSAHAFCKLGYVKVDQQAKRNIEEFHVAEKLRLVNRERFFDRFHFH